MPQALTDEHALLLWQTCAYADDVTEAVHTRKLLIPTVSALTGFLHRRLLPYLVLEEEQLASDGLRDDHLVGMLLADHDRIRADVDNIEGSSTRQLLAMATDTLVSRLGHHAEREETWVTEAAGVGVADWGCYASVGDNG